VWTDASSRSHKEHIAELSTTDAMTTLAALKPVTYNYKVDGDQKYVGFIAEDVPDLVARKDRKSLSPMDIVAVLTKVVQEKTLVVDRQKAVIEQQQQRLDSIEARLAQLEAATKSRQAQ
jgi:hypothetical protein